MRRGLVPLLAAALAGAPAAGFGVLDGAFADHVASAGGLRAVHAWTRATDGPEAFVFVDLENRSGAERVLTGARSAEAAAAALVGFRFAAGQPVWEAIGPLPLAPGTRISLAPSQLAIRLDGIARALVQGDRLAVTLETDGPDLAITVAVEAEDATRHSHAGTVH